MKTKATETKETATPKVITKCIRCGSDKLTYKEKVVVGIEIDEKTSQAKNIVDDGLVCECGATNSLNGESYIVKYNLDEIFDIRSNSSEEENSNWIPPKVGFKVEQN